jgi:hypothetical protein
MDSAKAGDKPAVLCGVLGGFQFASPARQIRIETASPASHLPALRQ